MKRCAAIGAVNSPRRILFGASSDAAGIHSTVALSRWVRQTLSRRANIAAVLLGLPTAALNAQSVPEIPPQRVSDGHGVDLLTREPNIPTPALATAGLQFHFDGWRSPIKNNFSDAIIQVEDPYTTYTHLVATFNGDVYQFDSVAPFPNINGSKPATLVQSSQTTYQMTTEDGTKVTYDTTFINDSFESRFITTPDQAPGVIGTATSATKPDGEVLTYYYIPNSDGSRELRSVESSLGWMVKINSSYVSRNISGWAVQRPEPNNISIVNRSVDYCSGTTLTCSVSNSTLVPSIGVSTADGKTFQYTDYNGQPIFTMGYNSYSFPSGAGYGYAQGCTTYCPRILVDALSTGSSVWNYSVTNSTNNDPTLSIVTVSSTDPYGKTSSLKRTYIDYRPLQFTDEIGRSISYSYDGNNYVVTETWPDATYSGTTLTGGYTQYDYNSRKDIIDIKTYPKGGGQPLVTSFTYEASCTDSNFRYCNKPETVTDPRGNTTTYTYAPEHGGVRTKTAPADAQGRQAQSRYTYAQYYPREKDSTGALINSLPVWRVSSISECINSLPGNPTSCVGSTDEVVTTFSYQNDNVLLTSKTVARGDGSNAVTSTYGYDYAGRLTSIDDGRTDVDDKRYMRYDNRGHLQWEIGPDPDGSGSLPRHIIHHLYDADGREYRTEFGTGNALDGSDFVLSSFKRMTFDPANGKLVKTEVVQP